MFAWRNRVTCIAESTAERGITPRRDELQSGLVTWLFYFLFGLEKNVSSFGFFIG